ncbi:hypothetical protein SP90_07910 [Halodesulfovibrio spirochaetisodalis]|uniref:Uncharacterized protein n=1 Tax=Halodesulfovibrio spirochaetisodalis TaxID=1560234 RepID=A0A1B7XDI5_9BACT|nr:hypothetical protein SP90_07910 [Halodesulfovibrio spirochaetisodalis]
MPHTGIIRPTGVEDITTTIITTDATIAHHIIEGNGLRITEANAHLPTEPRAAQHIIVVDVLRATTPRVEHPIGVVDATTTTEATLAM